MSSERVREVGLVILRAGLGGMMVYHGWPKILAGPAKWEHLGAAMAHLGVKFAPEAWGLAAALAETVGGALLVIGLLTRPAAGFLLFTMFVAANMHYRTEGLGEASHAVELGIAFLSLLLMGPGPISLDAKWRGNA